MSVIPKRLQGLLLIRLCHERGIGSWAMEVRTVVLICVPGFVYLRFSPFNSISHSKLDFELRDSLKVTQR
jgi:hypothetical protein